MALEMDFQNAAMAKAEDFLHDGLGPLAAAMAFKSGQLAGSDYSVQAIEQVVASERGLKISADDRTRVKDELLAIRNRLAPGR